MKQLSAEQIQLIKKPLPKEAVKPHPTRQGLSTIKAIYVTERFNEVFGIGAWSIKTEIIPITTGINVFTQVKITSAGRERTEFTVMCKTILEVAEYGIYYECVASSTNDDMGDAAKGATTDAMTKIASYIGIGMDVFKGMQDAALAREAAVNKATPQPAAEGEKPSDKDKAMAKTLWAELKDSHTNQLLQIAKQMGLNKTDRTIDHLNKTAIDSLIAMLKGIKTAEPLTN